MPQQTGVVIFAPVRAATLATVEVAADVAIDVAIDVSIMERSEAQHFMECTA